MSASQFDFDRYINGVLMAEGVTIERQSSFENAARVAARIASRGPNGEVPVLVLRVAVPPAGFSIVHKDEMHAPSVERAIAVAEAERKRHDVGDGFDSHPAHQAAVDIKDALRELMKEVGE